MQLIPVKSYRLITIFCSLALLIGCQSFTVQPETPTSTIEPTVVPTPTVQVAEALSPTIFYLAPDEGGQIQLYALTAADTPMQITNSEKDIIGFDISPDGVIGFNTLEKIYLVDEEGAATSIYDCVITVCLDLFWHANDVLGFSYDGSLQWLNAETGEPELMFGQDKVLGTNAALSPDEQWLSYTHGMTYAVELVNRTTEETLSFESGSLYPVSWHPSGTNFVTSQLAFAENEFVVYIMLYDFISQTSINLTNTLADIGDDQPVYSPDGNMIVFKRSFTSREGTLAQVWLVDQTGENSKALLDDLAYVYNRPIWLNNTHILAERISADGSGVDGIVLVNIATGSVETVIERGSLAKVFVR